MSIKHLKALILCTVATASVGLVSCGGDDNTVVENSIAPTNPSGFVVMAHPSEVVNGDTATLLVRINPATAKLTKDQLAIDCVNSDIYNLATSDASASSRSSVSYVQTSSNYTLLDLVPDTLGNDTLQGQWQAKVLVKTDKNIFDKSTLALVATYKDSEGKTVNVSSDPFQMTLVPTPADGITAWSPAIYTDTASFNADSRTPYYWVVKGNTYRNADGMQQDYKVADRIRSTHFALNTIDNDTTTQAQTVANNDNEYLYSFLPLVDKVPFSGIAAGNVNTYKAKTFFTLVDKTGHECTMTCDCSYVGLKTLVLELDCPEELQAGTTYSINLDEALADYGYSSETLAWYTSRNYLRIDNPQVIDHEGWQLSYGLSDDHKTLTVTPVMNCNADMQLANLRSFIVRADLNWPAVKSTSVALYKIKLKRKGA